MLNFIRRHAWWIIPLIIADVIFFRWLMSRTPTPAEHAAGDDGQEEVLIEPREPPGLFYVYPTDQRDLWNTESEAVYQPTASGRVESALYGSTRTRSSGGQLLPAFHEGIDIAPLRRDRRGRPLDEIYAVTDGRVAYINRVGGNSTYGIYVVLVHDDPVGEIYTLYAHLARAQSGLSVGDKVAAGDVIGVMGNTMSSGLPMHRAHLHLEIGVIMNRRFQAWYRAQKLTPDHGKFHGHNLTGIDPLDVWGRLTPDIQFSMLQYLRECPPAFRIAFHAAKPLDYFARYPARWTGKPFVPGPIVLTVSEGGVPLSGRLAEPGEVDLTPRAPVQVLAVDEEVLGRNGLRLVVRRGGQWVWSRNGERWLDILTY